jgi:hypothetical protein
MFIIKLTKVPIFNIPLNPDPTPTNRKTSKIISIKALIII